MTNQHQSKDKNQKSGNFKDDPEKAREAGQKGSSHSHGNKERE